MDNKPTNQPVAVSESKIGFKILSYDVISYTCKEIDLKGKDTELKFQVSAEYGIQQDLKTMLAKITIEMYYEKPNAIREDVVEFKGQALFSLIGLENTIINTELELPQWLVEAISNIAVSTSRGVLLMKNSGTKYAKHILPAIPTANIAPSTKWLFKENPKLEFEMQG